MRSHVAQSDEDDVAHKFLDLLENDAKDIFSNYFQKKMIYGEKEEIKYIASDHCHICGRGGFDRVHEDKGLLKVKDHFISLENSEVRRTRSATYNIEDLS